MINFSNLIQIIPTENRTNIGKVSHRHNQPTNSLLSYTRVHLIQIRQQTRHNQLLGLPSESIANICRLKIYKKSPRIKNKKSSRTQQHGINFRYICQIKTCNQEVSEHVKYIRLGKLNTRSIKK